MAFRRFHHINTGSFDAGVSQKIRQLCYILLQTVKTHRYRIYRKAGVGTHAELVELVSQSTASSEGSQ